MTVTAVRQPTSTPADVARSDTFAGTGTLIRFTLRRERLRLPAWLLGSTLLLLQLQRFVADVAATAEGRDDMSRFMDGGLGAIFGPGYGGDDLAPEMYIAGVYGLVFFVLAALMSIFVVARHTRVEEQTGRAELVRANVVGRYAHLSAALSVAAGANVALALLLGGAMTADGYAGGDGMLFGASVGAVGLVFAAVSALAVQVTEYSRAATGIAGVALGAAWAVRAAGDMVTDHGSLLSWFSPLAWSNQTRPYVDGRWWPLLLSVALAAATAAAGYALAGRRDVGAGLVAPRAGAAGAAPWLKSPLAVTFRLLRGGLAWWTAALAAFGVVFGALAEQVADPTNISEDRIEWFGGSLETVLDGYLGVITLFTAVLGGVMVVLGVKSLRAEETAGRAEPVLATATGRPTWFGSYLTVLAVGLVGLLLVVGVATGIGAAVATGDGSYVGGVTAAHVAHAPGVLVMLGIAALLFGILPRAIGAVWVILGYSIFIGLFGAVLDIPQGVRNLLPMEHTGRPPLDAISWPTTVALLATATVLAAVGLAGFRHRDLDSN